MMWFEGRTCRSLIAAWAGAPAAETWDTNLHVCLEPASWLERCADQHLIHRSVICLAMCFSASLVFFPSPVLLPPCLHVALSRRFVFTCAALTCRVLLCPSIARLSFTHVATPCPHPSFSFSARIPRSLFCFCSQPLHFFCSY